MPATGVASNLLCHYLPVLIRNNHDVLLDHAWCTAVFLELCVDLLMTSASQIRQCLGRLRDIKAGNRKQRKEEGNEKKEHTLYERVWGMFLKSHTSDRECTWHCKNVVYKRLSVSLAIMQKKFFQELCLAVL
ncbi:uncharacterized protein LOC121375655 [Gigantopelta aegis]|uniref:uncharacterized protein LOC121375655 n=1 Tax=Gigantopelta aegis TaxID=1735272 RepID=UPI001B88C1C2|nr:uncharacterized protein LOC121375655 [Gigantopelta aegis]